VKGARGLGPSVALYGTAHHLEQLAGYGGIRLVHHARVALGVAVYQPLLLPDILEGLAQPLPSLTAPRSWISSSPIHGNSAWLLTGARKASRRKGGASWSSPPPRGGPEPGRPALPISDAANIQGMRQLPEQCESCKKQIATLETCVLPDGTRKRGVEVTFRESAEASIRCVGCGGGDQT